MSSARRSENKSKRSLTLQENGPSAHQNRLNSILARHESVVQPLGNEAVAHGQQKKSLKHQESVRELLQLNSKRVTIRPGTPSHVRGRRIEIMVNDIPSL
eukprot:NODE_4197_length_687_cov_74.746082_g3565_i0.p3 GENE.NODE_4197_length_687_cov_74.746082_g3565_i0~~NODE_4197_length_687_cov_74.746082_g3565_i0.p3  ORF type:complete len:100 (-),score=12.75 NODE_4197_length_687_cov_74.746082_g3565_i0:79-378(-)